MSRAKPLSLYVYQHIYLLLAAEMPRLFQPTR